MHPFNSGAFLSVSMAESIILETVNSPMPNTKDEYTYNKIYQTKTKQLSIKSSSFWGMMPYNLIGVRQHFKEGCYVHLHCQGVGLRLLLVFLGYTLTLKMVAVNFSEMSLNIYQTIWPPFQYILTVITAIQYCGMQIYCQAMTTKQTTRQRLLLGNSLMELSPL
jgi:hypothetical protein